MARIEVRVLGRPHVAVDGKVVPITGRQLLLAVRLAIGLPIPVPSHRLLTDVWPDEARTDGALRVALSRLRRMLGTDVVRRVDNGYTLSSPTSVDADRFQQLIRAASDPTDRSGQRIATIEEALAMWRGPPFDGLERLPWVEAESVRLHELREQAIDERFALQLLLEESAHIIPDLRAELERDPTRERRAEMLAVILYRSGRQADALAVIERTRRTLRERLGLDPGPSLRELELRILRHDEELLLAPPAPTERHALETESRIRSAATLTRVGAYDEAHVIIDEAVAGARERGDRRALARALLAGAQTASLSGASDPHPLIDEAQSIGRELRDGALLAKCALVRLGSGVPSDKTKALIELAEPLDLLPASAPEQIDLLCAAAVLVIFIDASEAADRLMAAAERLHEAAPTARSEVVWLTARSIVGSVRGSNAEHVDAWASHALELARTTGEAELVVVSIQARLRALYTRGDLDAVDDLLDELDRSSRLAALPFGTVRVTLCRATNAIARGELGAVPGLLAATRAEGRRLRTFATEGAVAAQELMLKLELDELASVAALARPFADRSPANSWHAVLALCGDAADRPLIEVARQIAPDEDTFAAFTAIAAEVAARRGDSELGAWCLRHIEPTGDRTITIGLGTMVLGFARHFAGLARVATGDLDRAAADFEAAVRLSADNGAHLWRGHASVELADVLVRNALDRTRAAALVEGVRRCPAVARSIRLARRCDDVCAALSRPAG